MSSNEELEKNSAPNLVIDFVPFKSVFGSPLAAVSAGLILRNDHRSLEGSSDDVQEDRSNRFSF